MSALKLPAGAAEHARAIIAGHDFSSARAHLIPSVPGYHTGVSLRADQLAYGQLDCHVMLESEDLLMKALLQQALISWVIGCQS